MSRRFWNDAWDARRLILAAGILLSVAHLASVRSVPDGPLNHWAHMPAAWPILVAYAVLLEAAHRGSKPGFDARDARFLVFLVMAGTFAAGLVALLLDSALPRPLLSSLGAGQWDALLLGLHVAPLIAVSHASWTLLQLGRRRERRLALAAFAAGILGALLCQLLASETFRISFALVLMVAVVAVAGLVWMSLGRHTRAPLPLEAAASTDAPTYRRAG